MPSPEATAKAGHPDDPPAARPLLLVVEDDETMATALAGVLAASHRVVGARRLSQALDAAATERPDAVLLDLWLPDSKGLDTLHRVREALPATPIVVLTGETDLETGLQALRAGADDYLVKPPPSADTLLRTLRHAAERRKLEDERRRGSVTRKLVRTLLHRIGRSGVLTAPLRRELGRGLATEVPSDDLREALAAFEAMGLGELETLSRADERVTVAGRRLIEVSPGAGRSDCMLTLGFLEEAASRALGVPVLGAETRCESLGHPDCRFEMMARPRPTREARPLPPSALSEGD